MLAISQMFPMPFWLISICCGFITKGQLSIAQLRLLNQMYELVLLSSCLIRLGSVVYFLFLLFVFHLLFVSCMMFFHHNIHRLIMSGV